MKQKTEIEFDLSETITYVDRREKVEAHCSNCATKVEMVAPPVAAVIARITEREIYRMLETGKVHFIETDRVFICLNSLRGSIEENLIEEANNRERPPAIEGANVQAVSVPGERGTRGSN